MYIGQNIARIRKEQKITQEELGERVGVSNQAVSKWENGNTSPDISLLPMIASALRVSLQELFESDNVTSKKVTADDYPGFVFDELHKSFFVNSACRFLPGGKTDGEQFEYQKSILKNGEMLGCISNKSGAVVIKDEFAFIDTKYKEDVEDVFSVENASIIKRLSEPNVRKVLASVYSDGFKRSKNSHAEFSLPEITESCSLSEEATLDALNALSGIRIISSYQDKDKKTVYTFSVQKLLYALEIFRLAQMLLNEEVWLVIRDSSMISDYAFEACKKQ